MRKSNRQEIVRLSIFTVSTFSPANISFRQSITSFTLQTHLIFVAFMWCTPLILVGKIRNVNLFFTTLKLEQCLKILTLFKDRLRQVMLSLTLLIL